MTTILNERPKVLSLLQPWASLVALGLKKIETRSWSTKYRGPLLIHASKGKKGPWGITEMEKMFHDAGAAFSDHFLERLPFGCIIAVVTLFHVEKMTPEMIAATTRQEFTFGDWKPGRYAWQLGGAVRLISPIPFKGGLGLRDAPEELEFCERAKVHDSQGPSK